MLFFWKLFQLLFSFQFQILVTQMLVLNYKLPLTIRQNLVNMENIVKYASLISLNNRIILENINSYFLMDEMKDRNFIFSIILFFLFF